MRQESRQERQVDIAEVAGYHCGGYEKRRCYASDRPSDATRDYRLTKDGSMPAQYGIEWETEANGITDKTIYANLLKTVCFQHFHHDLWKIEDDATLGQGHLARNRCMDVGAECISQPMTRAYIRNHYRDFRAAYEFFRHFGIDCAKSGNCGQHVHVSLTCFGRSKPAQDEALRKLFYIINRHYDLMCALMYRRADTQDWCGRMDYSDAWTMDLSNMPSSHGNGCNYSHYRSGNVEIRIPGGQKNYACFRNTMESLFHLIDAAKVISRRDCDDVTKIFAGCNQHVFDRLKTYCYERGTITMEQLDAIRGTVKVVDFK